jgi:hypothetical protein
MRPRLLLFLLLACCCALCATATSAAASPPSALIPGDPAPAPLCLPLLATSANADADADADSDANARVVCLDPAASKRALLLYVFNPSDAFSRRAVAPDSIDLFLKELEPLLDLPDGGVPFDFVFLVESGDNTTTANRHRHHRARAAALLGRLEAAVERRRRAGGTVVDVGPIVTPDEAAPPARVRYGVVAAPLSVGDGDNGDGPLGWVPSVLSAWTDPNAMRVMRVWAPRDEDGGGEDAAQDGGGGGGGRFAASPSSSWKTLVTVTRLGSRYPWLLPGFQLHPSSSEPNASLSYRLAAVDEGFVRSACAGGGDGGGGSGIGGPTEGAVVLIPFAYGSSPEAEGGRCTYWHVLKAAQQELGAVGALFHAPLPPPPSSSSSAPPSSPPTAPGGFEEQLFQPSYVPWLGNDQMFDEYGDPGPDEGGADVPAASIEQATAAAIRRALLECGGDSSSSSSPRAGFFGRPLPSGAAALAINPRGRLQEAGWLQIPSLEHLAWAARFLAWREAKLDARLDALERQRGQQQADEDSQRLLATPPPPPPLVVPVMAATPLSADKGRASALVTLPPASLLSRFSKVEVDVEIGCMGDRDAHCPQWDHVQQVFACCALADESGRAGGGTGHPFWRRPACLPQPDADCWGTKWRAGRGGGAENEDDGSDWSLVPGSNVCGRELVRLVTPFRRRGGRWLVDVTRLRGLLHPPGGGGGAGSPGDDSPISCAFHMQSPPWAGPWVPRLSLVFSSDDEPSPSSSSSSSSSAPTTPATAAATPPAAVHVHALWPAAPQAFQVSESDQGSNCDALGFHPPFLLPRGPPRDEAASDGQRRLRLSRATLVATVTGHGAAEFVPSTHSFYLSAPERRREDEDEQEEQQQVGRGHHRRRRHRSHLLTADLAAARPGGVWGSGARGCVPSIDNGAVPNQHGTWAYTRAGWCDASPVDGPFVADATEALRSAWDGYAAAAAAEEAAADGVEEADGEDLDAQLRPAIEFGCLLPSFPPEDEAASGWRRAARLRRRRPAAVLRSADGPGRKRRALLDEAEADIMLEASLVLEWERDDDEKVVEV